MSTWLGRLHRARSRRTGVVLTVVLLVAALVGVTVVDGSHETAAPADSPTTRLPALLCRKPAVTCLDGRALCIELRIPVEATLPRTFDEDVSVTGHGTFELFRKDMWSTGVTVFEDAIPARDDDSRRRDPAAGTTAARMARRLEHRPFLTGAPLTRLTVDGRAAWRVTGDIRAGATLPATKSSNTVAPTFLTEDGGMAGAAPVLVGSYTLADQPHGGVTVVWSWHYGVDRPSLAGNDALVDDLLTPSR